MPLSTQQGTLGTAFRPCRRTRWWHHHLCAAVPISGDLRPDLRFVDIRGNVQTRLRKISEGLADATILAMAGLQRMDLLRATGARPLDPITECAPAPGQGVIAVDCRADDALSAHLATRLNHHDSATAVTIERQVLAGLRGGCSLPLGCFAQRQGSQWHVHASLHANDQLHQVSYQGPAAQAAAYILNRLPSH